MDPVVPGSLDLLVARQGRVAPEAEAGL
eukprot:IDg6369t1